MDTGLRVITGLVKMNLDRLADTSIIKKLGKRLESKNPLIEETA